MKAALVRRIGGPENIEYADTAIPEPGPGEARVKLAAAGVNYIDTYFRTGLYKANLPVVLGQEGAGTVDAIGADVAGVTPGERVAYCMVQGSYAEYAVVPAWKLVKLPDSLDFDRSAAVLLQGMTAHYLTHSTFELKDGDTCLIHAAAGGVGLLLVQICKMLGARVIGTAGTQEKAQKARDAGADETIVYTQQDFVAETKRITGGRGVDVVYDSVGKSVFLGSLDCLRPRGMLATFGNASGAVPPFEPLLLSQKGSLFVTRPTLYHYAQTKEELDARAGDVLRWVDEGKLKVEIYRKYPLSEAGQAHRDLESRRTSGKLLLIP
jgi:NADPH2:quinone reductase